MALTDKQRVWMAAYLGEAHYNASEAARIAGYEDPQQSGWENKTNLDIHAEIQSHLAKNCLTPEEVLSRLSDQARGVGEFVKGNNGREYLDTHSMRRQGKGHLIKGVRRTKFGRDVEIYDAQSALRDIGRHHKLFTDKTEQTVTLDGILNNLPAEFREAVRTELAKLLQS